MPLPAKMARLCCPGYYSTTLAQKYTKPPIKFSTDLLKTIYTEHLEKNLTQPKIWF